MNFYNDKVKGNAYTSGSNTWAFVAEDGTLKHADIQLMSPPISRQEVDRLMDLREWWNKVAPGGPSKGDIAPSAATSDQASRKAMLLGDAAHRDFFDTTFKVGHLATIRLELTCRYYTSSSGARSTSSYTSPTARSHLVSRATSTAYPRRGYTIARSSASASKENLRNQNFRCSRSASIYISRMSGQNFTRRSWK